LLILFVEAGFVRYVSVILNRYPKSHPAFKRDSNSLAGHQQAVENQPPGPAATGAFGLTEKLLMALGQPV
jgi:hypothetical protein